MLPKQLRYQTACAMPRIPDRRYRWGGRANRFASACNQMQWNATKILSFYGFRVTSDRLMPLVLGQAAEEDSAMSLAKRRIPLQRIAPQSVHKPTFDTPHGLPD